MSTLFRRHSTVRCFFCLSPVPFPVNVRNFKCPSCNCWNRYDERGEIISDEPAMHEERLNSKAFAKRGAPSKDRLPNIYGTGPFCHSCQTNQMLLVNLLSNYLPEPDSPEYESRVEMLPAYRESLQERYPPVCETCMPLVEDEIKRKEHMARVHALGGWLNKGKDRQRRVSAEPKPPGNGKAKVKAPTRSDVRFWWQVRGSLWASTILLSMTGNLGAAYGNNPFRRLDFLQPTLPALALLSVFWAVWDPTYASVQKAQQQSREVRIHGKRIYNVLQMTTWFSRLAISILLFLSWYRSPSHSRIHSLRQNSAVYLSAFLLELIAIVGSISTLRIHQPPAIRLVDTSVNRFDRSCSSTPAPGAISPSISGSSSITIGTRSRAGTPSLAQEPDSILSSLSLSSKPILSRPVFGQTSLHGSHQMQTPSASGSGEDEDQMDWQPTNPSASGPADPSNKKRSAGAPDSGNAWLIRPQRFFAPEKPTGLEGLFESTKIQDEPMAVDGPGYRSAAYTRGARRSLSHRLTNHMRNWGALYVLGLAVFVAVGGRYYYRDFVPVPASGKGDSMLGPRSVTVDEFPSMFASADWDEWDEPVTH
ncbi:Ima1 N-terminal domain-containing protein [Crepidotus variabilis]|uniref:Ima1 N-terminal domain-containing protein n=1 Tax=Crepidotus variabilis TaxID=179855 RepID=A0A9P6JNV2_9AGAR|nr:Ima1 N-terminal domain-containing protein [Crepidotus variabilis]